MNDLPGIGTSWGGLAPSPSTALFIAVSRAERWRSAPKFIRRLARSIGYRTVSGPVDATAYGFKARFHPRDNLAEKRVLFSPQEWDFPERLALMQHFHRDFRFIDVGANAGFYSLFVSASGGEHARTIAIEPQPEMLRRLYFNIEANGMAEQISVIEKAVCQSIGETEFLVSTSNRGTSGLKSAQGETQSLIVATTTLASVILDSGWGHVDAIKLDIEGAEDQALPPLFDLRSSLWPRLILMETRARNWEVDLAGLLADKGYRISLQAKGNAVWVRK